MEKKVFIEKWTNIISDELKIAFPKPYLESSEVEMIEIPKIHLKIGSELFGYFELIDINGNTIFQANSIYQAKYILYANRILPGVIEIPKIEEEIKKIVKKYEEKIDSFSIKIKEDFQKIFDRSDGLLETSNQIFKRLNLLRY